MMHQACAEAVTFQYFEKTQMLKIKSKKTCFFWSFLQKCRKMAKFHMKKLACVVARFFEYSRQFVGSAGAQALTERYF